MKTHRLLTLLAATLLWWAASSYSSPAADVSLDTSSDSPRNGGWIVERRRPVSLDISSFAPRNPNVVLRQIELNVAIKQYEKVLMELHEARLQKELWPTETGLTDEQQKQWLVRAENKLRYLDDASARLRVQISHAVEEANKELEVIEKEKSKQKAKPEAAPSQPFQTGTSER